MINDKIIVNHAKGNKGMRRKLGKLMLIAFVGEMTTGIGNNMFRCVRTANARQSEALKA